MSSINSKQKNQNQSNKTYIIITRLNLIYSKAKLIHTLEELLWLYQHIQPRPSPPSSSRAPPNPSSHQRTAPPMIFPL